MSSEHLDPLEVTPQSPESNGAGAAGPKSAPRPTELRDRILAEATRAFAEHGFAGTSMRAVAEAAQCTKPALYYHFKSKEGLFLEVIRAATSDVTALIEEAIGREGTARERIATGIRVFFQHLRQAPEAMAVLFRAELEADEGQPEFDFRGMRELHIGMCKRVIEDGIQRGEVRRDVDPHEVVLALVGMVDFRCRLYVGDQYPIPDPVVERMVSIFFDGVAS